MSKGNGNHRGNGHHRGNGRGKSLWQRFSSGSQTEYVRDAVLGATDGIITTFAVVSGATGGDLAEQAIIIIGAASLLADAFSMGVSNYLGLVSERQRVERTRREERREIEEKPEEEREEIREIYSRKGFRGRLLERVVDTITGRPERWVDEMLLQEKRMLVEARSPRWAGFVTFAAFILAGAIPLFPFLTPGIRPEQVFWISSIATAAAFLIVGFLRGLVLMRSMAATALATLLMGGGAAVLAYLVGYGLRQMFGAGSF